MKVLVCCYSNKALHYYGAKPLLDKFVFFGRVPRVVGRVEYLPAAYNTAPNDELFVHESGRSHYPQQWGSEYWGGWMINVLFISLLGGNKINKRKDIFMAGLKLVKAKQQAQRAKTSVVKIIKARTLCKNKSHGKYKTPILRHIKCIIYWKVTLKLEAHDAEDLYKTYLLYDFICICLGSRYLINDNSMI